jgi:uracil-DNA glycosylase family 4
VTPGLASFRRDAEACRRCVSLAPWRKFPFEARGNPQSRIIVLGEAPGRVSLDNRRPFSNPRNLMIRQALARAVAPRECTAEQLVYFTDTVKCWPSSPTGANRSPSASEASTCVELHLSRELSLIKPVVIFAFGKRAVDALLGRPTRLASIHGQIVESHAGYRMIPLMHPSTINIAGMRRVGIVSLDDYEIKLAALFRCELDRLRIDRSPETEAGPSR